MLLRVKSSDNHSKNTHNMEEKRVKMEELELMKALNDLSLK